MREWRLIDTAPKDGTEIDGWGYYIPDSGHAPIDPDYIRITDCYFGERDSDYVQKSKAPFMGKEGWCVAGDDGWSWAVVLTHWMPIPDGPKC